MSNPAPILIQVLAKMMPGRDGVCDHALALARELETAFGIGSAFAVVNADQRCAVRYPAAFGQPIQLLEKCLELSRGRPAAILVHMSGYGYARDGAPSLLADGLERVEASGQFLLGVYFHELFATGMPWRSAFWHTRRQQKAVLRIASQCSLILTNIERHANWLKRQAHKLGDTPIEQLPVFSTVGEAEQRMSFGQRDASLVIFGLASGRECSYRQLAAAEGLVRALGIEEILDVGPECNQPSQVHGIPVRRIGLLPAEDVPALFSRVRFGFVHHVWNCLGKSSILAAYCAQGVVPVLGRPFPRIMDGLADGVQVVTPQTAAASDPAQWEQRSRAGWDWYRAHRVHVHAQRYANWLGEGL